jgi:hypothetical protein
MPKEPRQVENMKHVITNAADIDDYAETFICVNEP